MKKMGMSVTFEDWQATAIFPQLTFHVGWQTFFA